MSRKGISNPTAHGSVGKKPSKAYFEEGGKYDLAEFHRIFISCGDLTEYEPSMLALGDVPESERWVEWNRLKRDWPAFNTHLANWKAELEVKFKSVAIKQIQKSAVDGNMQASKWIAEGGYDKRSGAGRPSAAEKKRQLKEIATNATETKQEEERMLKVMDGGKL